MNSAEKLKYKIKENIQSRKVKKNLIEFSKEEKKLLEGIFMKISYLDRLTESLDNQYLQYTEEQIDDELIALANELRDIEEQLWDTSMDDRKKFHKDVDIINDKLLAIEEYADQDQLLRLRRINDMMYTLRNLIDRTELQVRFYHEKS